MIDAQKRTTDIAINHDIASSAVVIRSNPVTATNSKIAATITRLPFSTVKVIRTIYLLSITTDAVKNLDVTFVIMKTFISIAPEIIRNANTVNHTRLGSGWATRRFCYLTGVEFKISNLVSCHHPFVFIYHF